MTFDALLVGGGLQNGLIALAILRRDPNARIALIERDETLGGNHTWSFHAGDLTGEMTQVVEPLVARRWPAYDVVFPALSRRLERPYACLTSETFDRELRQRFSEAPHARLYLGTAVASVSARSAWLADGATLEARFVVDARGPSSAPRSEIAAGYQKFLGLELELESPSPITVPLIMDARVEQLDGFRFFYALPFTPTRLLVEDTYYSDTPDLDLDCLETRVRAYAQALNLDVRSIARREHGVLPLPFDLPSERSEDVEDAPEGPLLGGYAGGWFHPTTGYSLACAAQLASLIASAWPERPSADSLRALKDAHRRQAGFFTLLNRLLFRTCAPEDRWRILERFHRLPETTVERFYGMQLTWMDRARVFVGRPPRGIDWGKTLSEFAGAVG